MANVLQNLYAIHLKLGYFITGLKRIRNKYKQNYMTIGKYTYGKPRVVNFGDGSHLYIGKFCSISNNVTIFLNSEHRIDWVSTYPFPFFFTTWSTAKGITNYATNKGNVIIGNDVWIGYNATILSGVKIMDGAVIGAGSIVTKDVAPYTIVAGNPAKVIRKRFDEKSIEKLLKLKWWDWDEKKISKNLKYICSDDLKSFFSNCK